MKTTGRVNGIISNIVIVKADGAVGQNEICYVYAGNTRMMAEVIKVMGDDAYVQVFDSTRGLKIGDRVEFEGHMLEVTLAPGLLSRNYDGLPLSRTTVLPSFAFVMRISFIFSCFSLCFPARFPTQIFSALSAYSSNSLSVRLSYTTTSHFFRQFCPRRVIKS